ncbi:MAG TPA: nucleotide disphospho-sugar-binding domain-containing protein [Edaphobacter sp.]|nr:nucleotide disphospho-sugar-binding domain-containing protein [Edaphobacter sp.]
MAEACAGLDVQLILSLGGGLDPARLGTLAGDPIVVSYAPQLQLLKRTAAVITHAGLNTVLESLAEGVPLVALPQGNDQPGVAARLAAHGAGIVISRRKLNAPRLRNATRSVLTDPQYRAAALRLQSAMQQLDGLETAANIIEDTLNIREFHRAAS